jgi:hypothetical protein
LLVHTVIALLVVGSLYELATDSTPMSEEHWPFLTYPMYSETRQWGPEGKLQLYGVALEEPHQEIPLSRPQYNQALQPFNSYQLGGALGQMITKTRGDVEKRQQMLEEALLDILQRYETLRLSGTHDGPPLQGIRLYATQWERLDAWARDVDQPSSRQLVVEQKVVKDAS